MAPSLTDPAVLLAIVAGSAGLLLLAQAHVQSRLLRRRIATGAGTQVIDPATGLWSSTAAWQAIRAESNRALRLDRPLGVWVGTAPGPTELDEAGRALVFDLPGGAMGIRLDETNLCVVSCVAFDAADLAGAPSAMEWRSTSIAPSGTTAADTKAFIDSGRTTDA